MCSKINYPGPGQTLVKYSDLGHQVFHLMNLVCAFPWLSLAHLFIKGISSFYFYIEKKNTVASAMIQSWVAFQQAVPGKVRNQIDDVIEPVIMLFIKWWNIKLLLNVNKKIVWKIQLLYLGYSMHWHMHTNV